MTRPARILYRLILPAIIAVGIIGLMVTENVPGIG